MTQDYTQFEIDEVDTAYDKLMAMGHSPTVEDIQSYLHDEESLDLDIETIQAIWKELDEEQGK